MTYRNYIKNIGGRLFEPLLTLGLFSNLRIILMYHRVVNNLLIEPHDPDILVTSITFESHVKELSRFFDIVPLETLVKSNARRGRLCALTFDDGWRDNHEFAFPILKKYNIPATIFISVNMIGSNRRFWFENILDLAEGAKKNGFEAKFSKYFRNVVPFCPLQTLDVASLADLVAKLKLINAVELDHIIDDAYRYLALPQQEKRSLLNWEEVYEMARNRISFGSHGMNHYILPALNYETKKQEIFDSLRLLREREVMLSPFFCYPNGDWDSDSLQLVYKAGYQGGVTTRLGRYSHKTNPYLLRRVGLHEDISHSRSLFWFRIFQAICIN